LGFSSRAFGLPTSRCTQMRISRQRPTRTNQYRRGELVFDIIDAGRSTGRS
jgi:hypothetical protein